MVVIVGRFTESIERNFAKLKNWVAWGSRKSKNSMTPYW